MSLKPLRAPFDIVEAFKQMQTPYGLHQGPEWEQCRTYAESQGQVYDKHRIQIPIECLAQRDLTVASTSAGGFLADMATVTISDTLRPYSVAVEAGATVMPAQTSNAAIAIIKTRPTGFWLNTENSSITESQPVLSQGVLSPKNGGVYMEFSRLVKVQAAEPLTSVLLATQLIGTVADLLDQAVVNGSGASGQPTGIMNTAGVASTSGTSLSWAGVRAMRKVVLNAGGRENRLSWIGAPDVQETLSGRERHTGGGRVIWDDTGIGSRPSFATSNMPAGTLLLGDFSKLGISVWGGVGIEINPYQGFQQGVWSARVVVCVDLAVMQPGAFTFSTSVT